MAQIQRLWDGSQGTEHVKKTPPSEATFHGAKTMLKISWEWTYSENALVKQIKTLLLNLVGGAEALKGRYDDMAAEGHRTTAGVRDMVVKEAKGDFANLWREADSAGWQKTRNRVLVLQRQMVPVSDKGDVAGAVIRSDIRRLWVALPIGPRMQLLLNPTQEIAQALTEVPPALIGLSTKDRALLMKGLGEHLFPEESAEVAELLAVRTYVGSVLTMVQSDLMAMFGVDAEGFEAIVWKRPLLPEADAFKINGNRTGPNVVMIPGETGGLAVDVVSR